MMNRIKSLFASFLLIVGVSTALGQQSADQLRNMKKGTSEFNSLKYASAIHYLNMVLMADSSNVKAQEMIAFSYRQIKNYDRTLFWYDKLSLQKELKPEWALYFAEALANKQQYEKSEQWYRKYLVMIPSDKRASSFSRTNIGNFSKDNGQWRVAFTNINSSASDYSPTYYKEGLLFASNRVKGKLTGGVFPWDNSPYSDLFIVENVKSIRDVNPDSAMSARISVFSNKYIQNHDDTEPTSNDSKTLGNYRRSFVFDTLSEVLGGDKIVKRIGGRINTGVHEGPAAVFPDGSIIFTRNNYYHGKASKSKEGVTKLKLYIAWGKGLNRIAEFPYNSNEYSVGHPTLNRDGSVLIFASDMPGGYGGTDLYYCVRSGGGQWTRPVNMGKQINTEGNEQFPYLTKDGTLFFSSTGHAGLGGLDIFQVLLKDMKPQYQAVNLGVPINSPYDDFGLIRSEDGKSGYFSSNRRGDDNIYRYQQATHRIILEGTIRDAATKLPLVGSRLLLRHLDGSDTLLANMKGQFRRDLPKETDFEVTAQKLGYVNHNGFITTVGITRDSVIKMDVFLNKTERLQQYIISKCDSLKKVFAVKNIYYDLDRSEIKPESRPALDELAGLMRRYPDMTVITSSHCDSRASDDYNRALSLRRGAAAKSYLVSRGISPTRIKVEYYGKTRLINRCYDGVPCSEADQQMNRRTEFDVILNGVNLTKLDCE